MLGLDGRVCVGLVLAITGIHAVGSPLNFFVQFLMFDPSSSDTLLFVMPLLVVVLQIAAGCAFAFGGRAAWPLLAGYLAAAIALVILVLVENPSGGELSLAPVLIVSIETLGPPVVAMVAVAIARPGTPRTEAGVLLIVFGISAMVGSAIYAIETLRWASLASWSGIGGLISTLVVIVAFLAIAILQTRAGLALRGGAEGSDRALGVYVVVALVGEVLLLAIRVGSVLLEHDLGRPGLLLSMHVIAAIDGIAIPLVIWAFVRRDRGRSASTELHVPMAPAWIALLWVPFLAARPWVAYDAVTPVLGGELAVVLAAAFAAQAIATSLAVGAAVGERLSTAMLAMLATMFAIVTTSTFLVIAYLEPNARPIQTGPLVTLAVAGAVLAWLHRTATGPLPRAVIR